MSRLELNYAPADDLASVPGIDEDLAARIVDHRERAGGFRSVSDVVEVPGVSARLARDLETHCIVEQYVRNVRTASEPPSVREDISAIRYRADLAASEKPSTHMKQHYRRRLLLRFARELDFGRPWSGVPCPPMGW